MSGRRVLVIDDDDAFRGVVARQLQRLGHSVHEAADVGSALSRAADVEPEWVVLDLRIGDENGLQLIEPLLRHAPHARIVLATGYSSIPTAVDAIRRGAWHYLAKPFSLHSLLRAFSDEPEGGVPPPVPQDAAPLRRQEWEHIQRVLAECRGNVSAAAATLGIHRRTLQRRLAKRPVRERPVAGEPDDGPPKP